VLEHSGESLSPPVMSLAWQDHAVIVAYLVGMLAMGAAFSRRQESEVEYYLGGRRMPWFAVGVSVIASLLSSLTYLSEPGEVWNSGITHMFGKMLAIPFEMAFVFLVCVPFMLRFRYVSAYEYLGARFGSGTRLLGVLFFLVMVVLWMGFVVLASSRALAQVSGMPLPIVVLTVGVVASVYTMLGGMRAVIWTDVIQVAALVGGALLTVGIIAIRTESWLPDWYDAAKQHLIATGHDKPMPLISFDPTVRTSVLTVALHMFVWHICTHVGNQMTVQRYFSTNSLRSALRSFVTGSLLGVGINLLLLIVGLALVYQFSLGSASAGEIGLDLTNANDQDLVYPAFAVRMLPPGVGGIILAALLAAAMSSIDSGINSMATVVSVEFDQRSRGSDRESGRHVARGRILTLAFGAFITFAALALRHLPEDLGIVAAMPRTFNAITGPLGGLFFIGMFVRRAGGMAAVSGALAGIATSLAIGYSAQIGALFQLEWPAISFTWVMPCSLGVTIGVAWGASLLNPQPAPAAELTFLR